MPVPVEISDQPLSELIFPAILLQSVVVEEYVDAIHRMYLVLILILHCLGSAMINLEIEFYVPYSIMAVREMRDQV
jgi:hypothetical protein